MVELGRAGALAGRTGPEVRAVGAVAQELGRLAERDAGCRSDGLTTVAREELNRLSRENRAICVPSARSLPWRDGEPPTKPTATLYRKSESCSRVYLMRD
jgi:hypothetical protein